MRTQAVILKKIPIREHDELIICYTKDAGKQVYQAKGILQPTSKQSGHLDILNLADFSLVHKNSHPIITSAYCLEAFPHLKSFLPAMAAAFFLLECFDKLIFEGEPDVKLWDFLVGRLRKFNQQSTVLNNFAYAKLFNTQETIAAIRQEFMKILGYDADMPIEHVAQSQFHSLQFIREMVK